MLQEASKPKLLEETRRDLSIQYKGCSLVLRLDYAGVSIGQHGSHFFGGGIPLNLVTANVFLGPNLRNNTEYPGSISKGLTSLFLAALAVHNHPINHRAVLMLKQIRQCSSGRFAPRKHDLVLTAVPEQMPIDEFTPGVIVGIAVRWYHFS
jgi:hypothetical protein